jgi:hypothetical protein
MVVTSCVLSLPRSSHAYTHAYFPSIQATRFPSDTFSGLKPVQGVLFDSGTTSYYTSATQIAFGHTSRNTFAAKRPNGDEYAVEELVAMQLDYVRELASSVAGESVRDILVTVRLVLLSKFDSLFNTNYIRFLDTLPNSNGRQSLTPPRLLE